jgi:HAD superfamily hydrolase (TIGR01509 family)
MPMPTPIEAVLFDFDGVLVESANIHVAAWERTFRRMGWEIAPGRCDPAAEVDDRRFLAGLLAEQGIDDADLDGWVMRKQEIAGPLFADGAAWPFPGVLELVSALRGRGVRLGVVSGSWRANIDAALDALGIGEAFELVVAKEDAAAKPDPAPYLLAVERLGVAPARAVAIEDSPTGLESARAAGLRAIAVGHRREAGDWAGDAPYLAGFEPLGAALAALGLDATLGTAPHGR